MVKIKTPDIIKFETETSKNAFWKEEETKNFKRWKKGKTIYSRDKDKERVSFYLNVKEKERWKQFIDNNPKFKNISFLIRKVVSKFIRKASLDVTLAESNQKFFKEIHKFKDEITVIKGNAEILIKEKSQYVDETTLGKLKLIIDRCRILEDSLDNIDHIDDYDILIVDDHDNVLRLISEYYNSLNIKTKGIKMGMDALKELDRYIPRIILLDIMLIDKDGIELYDIIRANPRFDDVKIYIITAFSSSIAEERVGDREVDGIILKPFNLSELDTIVEVRKK